MKKNFKPIIIILIIAVIYFLIFSIFIYFNKNNIQKDPTDINENPSIETGSDKDKTDSEPEVTDENAKYLILNNKINKFQNNVWTNTDLVADKLFVTYIDKTYEGQYYLKLGNTWNLFDRNDNYVKSSDSILAFSNDFNIHLLNFNEKEATNIEYQEIKDQFNLDIFNAKLNQNVVYEVDLNNDQNLDKIVLISNLDYLEEKELYFSIIYVKINDQYYLILKDLISPDECLDFPIYNIDYVLQIENDSYASIVLNRKYFSNAGEAESNLVGFDLDKYKILF